MSGTAGPEAKRPGSSLGRGRAALAALISVTILLLDQAAKAWADRALAGQAPMTVADNFFHLTYHRNTGGVFGLFAGTATMSRRLFFLTASLLALAFVLYLIREWGRDSLLSLWGLSLICGGALGNLVDRVRYGEVIDFIDWHWYSHHWPTFNIADSAITTGTALLLLSVLLAPSSAGPDEA
jgi:signal peptidase II